jgi:hypothetical protein
MTKRKKPSIEEYSFSTVELSAFKASVDASINHEVRDPKRYRDSAKVYDFHSQLELEGIFRYPEERLKEIFQLTVYGRELDHPELTLTLKDCHVRDDQGSYKYRKVRGKESPVYDIPKNIGYLERQRGTKNWMGVVWVSQSTVTDMLTLLPSIQLLYLALHERRFGRHRGIVSVTLQTNNPEEE